MSGTIAHVSSEHVALSILLIGVLLFFGWFMWCFEQDQKKAKAKLVPPKIDTSDPYAPLCPFCMTPIVDERCENLDCWFMGHIVPIPEYRKRPVVHMGPRKESAVLDRVFGLPWNVVNVDKELPSGAYIDMSMATPQVMGLTAEQIRNMSMEDYARLRPQLLQRAKALHWGE